MVATNPRYPGFLINSSATDLHKSKKHLSDELASMNIALGDLATHVADAAHVLELDPLRASQQLNRRPARALGKWLRPERAMREIVMRFADA